ncbi:MAG: hypothetical protein EA417_13815 [Gammaproteobacteria bacterium]|nr:MAG: hypothetical protein EA417_13815 [Gammaproteobacteria bacterium]
MPTLTINGQAIPIPAPLVERVDLTCRRRAFSGRQTSARPGTLASVRRIPLDVIGVRMADIPTVRQLVADLLTPGTVEVGGDVIGGEGETIQARAVSLSYRIGPTPPLTYVSAELLEDPDA